MDLTPYIGQTLNITRPTGTIRNATVLEASYVEGRDISGIAKIKAYSNSHKRRTPSYIETDTVTAVEEVPVS